MTLKRRQHSAQSKAMIALEAVKERKTVNELAAEYGSIRPKSASGNGSCSRGCPSYSPAVAANEPVRGKPYKEELYQEIGRLKMELEWVKKKAAQFNHRKARR